jgi:hypothetical protein
MLFVKKKDWYYNNHTEHTNKLRGLKKKIDVKGPISILTIVLEGLRANDSSSLLVYSTFVTGCWDACGGGGP